MNLGFTFRACFLDKEPVFSLNDNKPLTVFAFIIFSSIETSKESSEIDSESFFILAKAAATMGSKNFLLFSVQFYIL